MTASATSATRVIGVSPEAMRLLRRTELLHDDALPFLDSRRLLLLRDPADESLGRSLGERDRLASGLRLRR